MKKYALLIALLVSVIATACPRRGETVRFGTYPKSAIVKSPVSDAANDGAISSAPDSITWVVLKVDGDKALLLSRDLLSARPWDATGKNLTWDHSSIRQWLNHDFLHAAFSPNEIDNIVPTTLDNSDQRRYGTPAGQNTIDRVFLLSVNEFDSLVKDTRYVTASPTSLAIQEGAYANEQGNSAWWLRSPGTNVDSPSYLSSAGELGTRAHHATEKVLGIRPALWIKLK